MISGYYVHVVVVGAVPTVCHYPSDDRFSEGVYCVIIRWCTLLQMSCLSHPSIASPANGKTVRVFDCPGEIGFDPK